MNDDAHQNLGAYGMKSILEARHDAEIPATTSDGPEKILVLAFARVPKVSIRGHDVHGEEIVDGHAVLAAEPAEPTAQRESGDAGRRVDSERGRKTEGLRFPIEIAERRAGFDLGGFRNGIDPDGFHA